MGAIDDDLIVLAVPDDSITLAFPAELDFATTFQAPFEITDCFKSIILRKHINCFSLHIICLCSFEYAFKVGDSTFGIIYVCSPVGMISIPSDLVIVGIGMIVPVMVCVVMFHISISVFTDMCLIQFSVLGVRIVNTSRCAHKPVISRFGRFPFTAKSAAATFSNTVGCHYIIFLPNCTADFIAIQIFFR